MIWLNPVPNLGWYCDTTPVPAVISFNQGMYVVCTPSETQSATTLVAAEQLGHDMVLAESAVVLPLSFRSFFIDAPNDGQEIYVIDSSNVITTGIFGFAAQSVTPVDGSVVIPIANVVGWSAKT